MAIQTELQQSARGGGIGYLSFWRMFSLRHAQQDWLQTLLLVLVLGLGVGSFLAIRMANRAAVEGFQLFTESLRGDTHWLLEAPGAGIGYEQIRPLRQALDPLDVAIFPVVEKSAVFVTSDWTSTDPPSANVLRLLGLDWVQLRSALAGQVDADELLDDAIFWPMLEDPHHILVSADIADELRLRKGDKLRCMVDGQPIDFRVAGVLPLFRGRMPLPGKLLLADLAALQKLGIATRLNRLEFVVRDAAAFPHLIANVGQRLQDRLPDGWVLSSPQLKQQEGEEMTAAFRLNLGVLSLIGLLVGWYLMAQAMDATVSRRRKEIATLRSLGVSESQIRRLWLSEGVLYGFAAALAGLLIGWLLAHISVDAVTTTVRSLYRDTASAAIALRASDWITVVLLSIGGSLLAAAIPANDAASTRPAQFLRIGKRIPAFALFRFRKIAYAMLVLALLSALLSPLTLANGRALPVGGYFSAFALLLGSTVAMAGLLPLIGRALRALNRDAAALRLAASRLQSPTSRHQLALAGCFVAIGMAAAMGFLINSFEETVTGWLEVRLQGDLFISHAGFRGSASDPVMRNDVLERIEAMEGIARMDRFRKLEGRVNGYVTTLAGSRLDLLDCGQQMLWLQAPRGVDWRFAGHLQPELPPPVIINESLARRLHLGRGDPVDVATPRGLQRFVIAAVQSDFSRDGGLLLMDLAILETLWGVAGFDTAVAFVHPDASPEILRAAIAGQFPALRIQLNPELKTTALTLFRETFAVTHALQWIGLAVSLAGLVLSLISLLRESGSEINTQRHLGMPRTAIAMATAWEGFGIAVAGVVGGALLSVALGTLLIFVINLQSFGWTLQVSYPFARMAAFSAGLLLISLLTAFLTGWLYLRNDKESL